MKRALSIFFFSVLIFSATATAAQSEAVTEPSDKLLKEIGSFDFENPAEPILHFRLLDNKTKLWLLGINSVQVWDIRNKKLLSAERHGMDPVVMKLAKTSVSPDCRKLFIERAEVSRDIRGRTAAILDLITFKYIKVFDESVVKGRWSKDGSLFVAIKEPVTVKVNESSKYEESEVSFWNGDTFDPISTIKVTDLDWNYLPPNGDLFFTTSIPTKKWLFGIPYKNGMANFISAWNPKTGKVERNLSVGGEDFAVLTWKLMPSPSGRYMAMVSKHRTRDEEHKILLWELNGSDHPKYTIKANPRIRDSGISYSLDEELFAVDSGKNIQIYNTNTGQKKSEVLNADLPSHWLLDNQIFLNVTLANLRAFSTQNGGGMIYQLPLIYHSYESIISSTTDANGNTSDTTETIITDSTTVAPHPDGKVFLTYSNQFASLYNAQTGELLKTFVRPPLSLVKQAYRVAEKKYVSSGGWSEDGKMAFLINYEKNLITLWDFKGTDN